MLVTVRVSEEGQTDGGGVTRNGDSGANRDAGYQVEVGKEESVRTGGRGRWEWIFFQVVRRSKTGREGV